MITKAYPEAVDEILRLEKALSNLNYNPDLKKMLGNIKVMVSDLSKKEVECRRIHNFRMLEEPLAELNAAVNHLEKLIIIAQLMN